MSPHPPSLLDDLQCASRTCAHQIQRIGCQHGGSASRRASQEVPDRRRRRRSAAGSAGAAARRDAVDEGLAVPLVGTEVDGGIRHDACDAGPIAPDR